MTLVFAACLAVLMARTGASAEQLKLTLTTEPPAERIIPNEAPAKVILRATHADGSAAQNAKVTIALDMPPKNAFFSTGFPIAEGTPLLRETTLAAQGELQISMLFPIRGAYAVNASAELPDDPASKSSAAFSIGVNEEPAVVRNFSVLICLLAGFGLISGFMLGRSARRTASTVPAAILLALLLRPATAHAHEEHGANPQPTQTTNRMSIETPAGDRIEMSIDREFATVGQLTTLKGSFAAKSKPAGPTQFTLSFTNLDHDTEIFRTQLLSNDGAFELQHEFVDGADHRILLSATPVNAPGAAPVEGAMSIAVHAIHPPAPILYRTLAFLVSVAAVGMVAGYFAATRLTRGRST